MAEANLSVHDNIIVSYEVHCVNREIVFKTEYPHEPHEFTNVTFSGVVAYAFKNQSELGNIIFDFEESSPMDIYDEHRPEILAGIPFRWFGSWAETREGAERFFQENGIKAWYLASSLGLSGWIVATSMQKERIS